MDFSSAPASNYLVTDLVKFLNRGFEAYFVPIQFNTSAFLSMLHKDSIDLSASRVLIVDEQPCGIALIARRAALRASRLAAMGMAKEMRGKGAGSWFMEVLITEARQRSDREMVLEVIEQNEPAVRLYRRYGFQVVRRLLGFTRRGREAEEHGKSTLYKIDLREMGQLISKHGSPDLPWQLSGESIARMNPPACAYRKGQAYAAVSNLEAEHVVIWSLLVEREARGKGLGADILKSVIANHDGKTWHAPAIFPEEFGKVFERADFEREELSQWQMRLVL
ncbi:MAG: GNAT family N-acetyltransferase [Anaerolineales bacterium]|nr:GNAT family N-acetyltransferase [Anaerolineales bacterium]